MNKKWLKMGAITLAIGMLAVASVAVYAQDSVVPPADLAAGDMVFGGRDGGRGGFGRGRDALAVVAELLGIDQAALVTELQAGKTIAQLAEEKGVSTDDIVAAVVAARQEMLTSAVEAGTLTQEQADARLALLQADAEALLDKTFTFTDGRGPGLGGDFGGGDGVLAIVAEQLGIEQAALMTELQAGKTIAELAEANGVSTDDIVAAIIAAQQERLDAAVADGRLTQEQADARIAQATTQLEALLDQPLTGGIGMGGGFGGPNGDGQRGGGRGHGNGFPGNPPGGQGGAPVPPGAAPEVTATPNV